MTSRTARVLSGAVAGGVATLLMDRATPAILERQSAADTRREEAARPNGKPAVANLVDRVAARLGLELDDEARATAGTVTHYALGVVPGAVYALLRRRVPLLGAGHGLVYGVLLWAINDELASTALRLAGPPAAYPIATHARGLVGHVVLGVGTDIGIDLLGVVG